MTRNLYLIRHATAEELANSTMVKDFDRELTSKGIMESARLGNNLKSEGIKFDTIYCSPSLRTLGTANLIAEQMHIDKENILADERLYGGGPRGYLALLNGISDIEKSVCIVGHNPDISFFSEYLTRDDVGGSMEKCSLIQLEFNDISWVEISQKMGSFVRRIDVKSLA